MNTVKEPITRWLRAARVAFMLDVGTRTLERMVKDGRFPKPLRIGRLARWSEADVAAAMDALMGTRNDNRLGQSNL